MKKGISLVALVITIIVLIILTSTAILLVGGEDGIFSRANVAKDRNNKEVAQEKVLMVIGDVKILANDEEQNVYEYLSDVDYGADRKNILISKGIAIDTSTPNRIKCTCYGYDVILDEKGNLLNEGIVIKPTSTTNHSSCELTMEWNVLGEIADAISKTSSVTYKTEEISANMSGTEYIIGIGDTKKLKYDGTEYIVRILGFNHDTILNTNNKAGISFEFISYPVKLAMNANSTNVNGYEAMPLWNNLQNDYYEKMDEEVKPLIKIIGKEYVKIYDDETSVAITSGDKLWLLSCSEIWNNGAEGYGYSIAKEGNQYKYYAKINATYNVDNPQLVKQYGGTNQWGWLRSLYMWGDEYFCEVTKTGKCAGYRTTNVGGLAFGFSI